MISSIKKLTSQKTELRVPSVEDVESVYSGMAVEEEGMMNYDEYLIMLFKVTLDGFGE